MKRLLTSAMECPRDAYYTSLLSDDNTELHNENASQAHLLSQSRASENEHVSLLPIPSQFGLSQGSTRKRVRTRNFTSQEDLMLVSAWLNVSMDSITGNDQRHQTYWERIQAYFHENKQFTSDRSANSLMHRWSIIQLAVGKFQGYLNQIEARNQSGITEQDKICQALEMYASLQKSSFPYIHCWNVLKYAPKFCDVHLKKKSKNSESSNPALSSPSTPDSAGLGESDSPGNEPILERPIGRNAAKENARKAKGKVNSEDDTKLILLELMESQKKQIDERKALTTELLKIEKDREEREKKKEDREQMLYEQKILATDTSNMDHFEDEYYTSLKAAIIEKRRNMGFTL